MKRNPAWIETFNVQFLGSVEVPHHQGNGILCAAMQKVRHVKKEEKIHMCRENKLTLATLHPAKCSLSVTDCDIEETDGTREASVSV